MKLAKDSNLVGDFITKYNSTVDKLVEDGLFSKEVINSKLKVKINQSDLLFDIESYGNRNV